MEASVDPYHSMRVYAPGTFGDSAGHGPAGPIDCSGGASLGLLGWEEAVTQAEGSRRIKQWCEASAWDAGLLGASVWKEAMSCPPGRSLSPH